MKRYLSIIVLFYIVYCSCPAQIPYFNIQFDNRNWWESSGYSTVETDSLYLVTAISGTPWQEEDTSYVIKINKFTGAITTDPICLYEGQGVANIIPYQDSYVIGGINYPHRDDINNTQAFFCKYDPQTGVVAGSAREFGIANWGDYPFRPIATSDGSIFTAGWSFPEAGPSQLVMIYKCNSNLEQQYLKLLPDGGTGSYYAGGAIENPDQSIIVVGTHRRKSPPHGILRDDALIFKINAEGNVKWWHEIPGTSDTLDLTIYDILPQADGTYIAVGTKRIGPVIGQNYAYCWVLGLNADGEILWQKEHASNEQSGWDRIIPSPDGNYYACGVERDDITYNDENELQYKQYGVVSKISPTGDLLWHRRYSVEQLNKHYDIFYNVMATADGGILCSGKTYQNDTTRQNAWIIKMDANGCLSPNCGGISGTVDLPVGAYAPLVIAPNPTAGPVRIEVKDGTPIASVACYTIRGELVYQKNDINASIADFDLGQYPAGMYICTVRAGGVLYVRQVVRR
jgi:hypothetical protein